LADFGRERGTLALQRRRDGQAGANGAVDLVRYAGNQSSKGGEFLGSDQPVLRSSQIL
jgi:hypothetical protein